MDLLPTEPSGKESNMAQKGTERCAHDVVKSVSAYRAGPIMQRFDGASLLNGRRTTLREAASPDSMQ